MENLPDKLLLTIFGFVHLVYDVIVRISPVCHMWNEIIHKTPSLWEHFHLRLAELTKQEREITLRSRCLRKVNTFIKCIRVPALDVVFGDDNLLFIHILTLEVTNITCIDIPSFPWSLQQFLGVKSAKNLNEIDGFGDLSNIQWTLSLYHHVSLINQGHLQQLKTKKSVLS